MGSLLTRKEMVLHFWFGIEIEFLVEKVEKKTGFKLDHTIAKFGLMSGFVDLS